MEIKAAVDALSALAQPSRLEAFRLLVSTGPDGLPAGEIAARLGVPPATLSFHLGLLVRAGLISAKRSGRSIIYALDPEGIQVLLEFLIGDCCQGRPELCAPAVDCVGCCPPAKSRKSRQKSRKASS